MKPILNPPKTSKTLRAITSTQNSTSERKFLTKRNNMTPTKHRTSAKTKLLVIFASAFIGLTSCEKPDKADRNDPATANKGRRAEAISGKEQLPADELSIPDELVREFRKIEPYSYIADFNKTEKINKNANKIMDAVIEKIVDTTSFTKNRG